MTNLDRPGLIELLERLGADSDKTALEAARALHLTVSESGLTWDHLLRPEQDRAEFDVDSADLAEPAELDLGADAQLIDRLLARENLSEITREELAGLKRDIANGNFTAMDSGYVLAIAKRLGVSTNG